MNAGQGRHRKQLSSSCCCCCCCCCLSIPLSLRNERVLTVGFELLFLFVCDFCIVREAGFLGDVNAQVKQVCEDLARDEEIVKAGAYNVVGFSQGGQFARALVQVCPTLETNSKKGMMPRANRLVSFGGQHQGVMEWPGCGDTMTDFFCTTLRGLMALGAYSDLVRKRLVQAQYFKDPLRYQEYLDKNIFLPYLNNEVEEKRNEAYADNLKALDLMVLYMWKQDETVVPRESSLFGVYNATTKSIQQLRDQDLYKVKFACADSFFRSFMFSCFFFSLWLSPPFLLTT